MRDPWLTSFLITPPVMCGVHLLPYSIAHDFILLGFGNGFATEVGEPTEQDLFLAVAVCSRTWEQNRKLWSGSEGMKQSARWVFKWWRKMDFAVASGSLRTYIEDYRMVPEHNDPPANREGKCLRAPLHWHLVHVLCDHYNMTLEDAWNSPYGQAKCLFDVWSETEGDETLCSVLDAHINELSREAEKAHAAGDTATMEAKYAEVAEICRLRNERRRSDKVQPK